MTALKRYAIVSGVLFFLWGAACVWIGSSLAKTAAFSENDILFEIDTPRVVGDMTEFSAWHARTKVHPLYVLLVNPLGVCLKILLKSNMTASIVISSFFGFLGLVLAFALFFVANKDSVQALLMTGLFAFSSSQWFLSVIPETASFAVCSVATTYLVFWIALKEQRSCLSLWIVAGILSMAITTTNFIQTLICFTVHRIAISKPCKMLTVVRVVAGYACGVFGLTAAFALLQKMIYPSSTLFFLPAAYKEEFQYGSFLAVRQPFTVVAQSLKHFFMTNVVAPAPHAYDLPHTLNPAITFNRSWDYRWIGGVALFLWLGLLGNGIVHMVLSKKMRMFFVGMVLCLMFNIGFHCFYGVLADGRIELFLYTGNVTLLVMSFIGLHPVSTRLPIKIALAVLLVLVSANNGLVIQQILRIFG